MILSDRSIREELAAGRIVIEPLDESCIQPSSVDLHIDRFFRVFRNHTMGYIDVKQDMEELTELVEIKGDDVFILHPGEFVLGSTAERVALPDDLVARLEGKALAITTDVPTPDGWRTMGDLTPGDRVFDETGTPCNVVAVSEVMTERECREVLFSDGTTVIADAQHLWRTVDKNGRRYGKRLRKIRTTDDIGESLMVRGERNHQIELTQPVQYPERVLPIDPYVLGAWLGDGTSTCADITTADQEILDQVAAAGYEWHRVGNRLRYRIGGVPGDRRDAITGRYAANGSLNSTLRAMGLLGHKHIPIDYQTASVDQRQALLEGLMDTDGYVDKWGRCEFTTIREPLAEEVAELVASLGFRPVIAKKRAVLNGVDCGPKYDVTFTPDKPVFRLRRKLARQKVVGRFHRFRAVAAVRPVPTVPVRCIQVDSPNGMFLITRAFVATHNSSLGRLGLLIHSSLPGDELVLVVDGGRARWLPIERVVRKEEGGHVIAFDPRSGAVALHAITGRYEGPPDRIFEVRLASGRAVRVTAGHNLFTRGNDVVRKIRTAELSPGIAIATGPAAIERTLAGDIEWDTVVDVRDTGIVEPIYDIEVRPGGRHIENFLAGTGGVFVSNTAGFVDAGWDGHLTLELSNVANLPITLYPGMKIGQISFLKMTTPADVPYGSEGVGSKYQGQRGPTPSRYFENFRER